MHACISHTPRAGLNPSSDRISVNTIAKHPPSVYHPGGKNCIRNCFKLYMSSIINYYMQHLPQRVAPHGKNKKNKTQLDTDTKLKSCNATAAI